LGSETTNWRRIVIAAAVTGLFTLVVSLGSGWLLSYIQMREPRLAYTTQDTIPFEGPTENLAIYHVTIENIGLNVAENVVCQISLLDAKILKTSLIAAPGITHNQSISDGSCKVEISNLNPRESVVISVVASSLKRLPTRPQVHLRGKGIVGTEASKRSDTTSSIFSVETIIALSGALAAMAAIIASTRKGLRRILLAGPTAAYPDQRQALIFLCGIHGLDSEMQLYRDVSSEVTYWSESDRFSTIAIRNPTGEDANKRRRVLEDLLEYTRVSEISRGIVHYNIARIMKAQGLNEKAEAYLKKARILAEDEVAKRLKVDPIFREK